MSPEQLDSLVTQLAEAIIAFDHDIQEVLNDVPDEDLADVIAACRREAEPGETKNFSMPIWAVVAELVEGDHLLRWHAKRAVALGLDVYCVACAGECKGHDDDEDPQPWVRWDSDDIA